jgi:hypothetical protein
MSHSLHAFFQTTKDRVGQWGTIEPPVISAAEQTRLSWARLARSAEEVPEVYRPFMVDLLADGVFPYAVITPTFAGFLRREPEKLVCSVGDQLVVAEKIKGELVATRYTFADIHYLEAGAVLLNDWLQIRGRTLDGTSAVTRFKFNAVTERLFTPFVEKIRGAAHYTAGLDRDVELMKFDSADLLSFKFRNYARRSILPGAQIIASIAQPEIRKTVVKVLGHAFQRTTATAHLLILTDRELIVIHDDPDSPKSADDTRYGGVWEYIPLNKITGVDQTQQESGLLALTVQLPHGDHVEVLFQPDRLTELERFLSQLIEWAPESKRQRARSDCIQHRS